MLDIKINHNYNLKYAQKWQVTINVYLKIYTVGFTNVYLRFLF